MCSKLLLVQRKESACGRNAVDAVADQFVGCVGKALKEMAVVERIDDLVRHRAAHDLVLHRKRPGLRIADVAIEALELAVEHQNADRHAIVGALVFPGFHRCSASVRGRIAAEASAASNSPVRRSASGWAPPAKRPTEKASIGMRGFPSSIISARV